MVGKRQGAGGFEEVAVLTLEEYQRFARTMDGRGDTIALMRWSLIKELGLSLLPHGRTIHHIYPSGEMSRQLRGEN